MTLSIVDFNGINYRLKFFKFQHNIMMAKIAARSNGFTLTLVKEAINMWDGIEAKPEKPKPKSATTGNPADLLVEQMKDLYLNGDDDDIKRTIADAFTKRPPA